MSRTLLTVLIGLVITAAAACNPRPPDEGDYVARVTAIRTAKDAQFQGGSEPVPEPRKSELLPLAYYPIDPSYNVPAILKPTDDKTIISMPTSSGQPRQERRAGTLEFTLRGEPMKLTAFVEADAPNMNQLFVPFSDQTSGAETYPAGRYLDLERTVSGYYELDFNRAYHPYCYYNLSYECPLPPLENRLKISIQAGEKLKKPEGKG